MGFKEQLRQQLEKLRIADPEHKLFGTSSHKYAFGSKLKESDILAFEKKYGCSLPESYKTYLTDFGNGGAGPFYGVQTLGTMDEEPFPDYIVPSAPFRFTEAYNNDDMIYVGLPEEENFENSDEFEEAYQIWEDGPGDEQQMKYYEEHGLDQGAIPICHYGCGQRGWLVVDKNSPEFGNVWDDYVCDNMGVSPALNNDGETMDFGGWILDWCTKSILNLKTSSS